MYNFLPLLSGGGLRSIGQTNEVMSLVDSQKKFDAFFDLFQKDPSLKNRLSLTLTKLAQEKIPSIDARIRKKQNRIEKTK